MKNKYHRNGEVTFWNVYRQGWQRLAAADISDQILATMNDKERARIARHALHVFDQINPSSLKTIYMVTIPPNAVEWKGPKPPKYTDIEGLSEFFSLPPASRAAFACLELGKTMELMMGLTHPIVERVR